MTVPRQAITAGIAAVAALALVGLAAWRPWSAPAAVGVAAALLVPVRLAWGGSVPMGVALAVPVMALAGPWVTAALFATAIVLVALAADRGMADLHGVEPVARCAVILGGAWAGGAAAWTAWPDATAAITGAAGLGALVADVGAWRLVTSPGRRFEVRNAVPAYFALGCAGALVAVATVEIGVAMASIAAFPLLITRFAFERYATATDTLHQTIQALGLVPELAGVAPLGHSERSAGYAAALATKLRRNPEAVRNVVAAARLHHLGAVSEGAGHGPTALASTSARLAREAGLPADVARLLQDARVGAAEAPSPGIDAAIVRIAADFDELVGDDASATDHGLAAVSGWATDPASRSVAAALLELAAADPDLAVTMAQRAQRFRSAAVGVDLHEVTATRPGTVLRLPRRA